MPLESRELRRPEGWGIPLLLVVAAFGALIAAPEGHADEPAAPRETVEFNRHIRPILSEKCLRCHGPDTGQRKADLRLDDPKSALAAANGAGPIVPGKPDDSEVILRITSSDAAERMPPADSGLTLTPREIELLREWVAQGAVYQPHWSFVSPKSPPLPEQGRFPHLILGDAGGSDTNWPRNAIDAFILDRLHAAGLSPSRPATKEALLRRVTLDLTGLPPTPDEIDEFLADDAPNSYDKVVDRLLASPRYGEHMAVAWLDAARYSDTNGYFTDAERKMWRWRDWVIQALNGNMPFDQFTIEQLAGDLLPNATREQQIATGFHRNHMMNDETGIIDEEFRVEYVADRTDTTGTVWMGLTLGCARCHDHKYDPTTQEEYYRLFAFFNNLPEKGTITSGVPTDPTLSLLTAEEEQAREALRQARAACEKELAPHEEGLNAEVAKWEPTIQEALPAPPPETVFGHFDFNDRLAESGGRPVRAAPVGPTRYKEGFAAQALEFDGSQHVELTGETEVDPGGEWTISFWIRPLPIQSGCIVALPGEGEPDRGLFVSTGRLQVVVRLGSRSGSGALAVTTTRPLVKAQWQHLSITSDGSRTPAGISICVDGIPRETTVVQDDLTATAAPGRVWRIGGDGVADGFIGRIDELRLDRRAISAAEVATLYDRDVLAPIVPTAVEKRSARQKEQLLDAYVRRHAAADVQAIWKRLLELRRQEAELDAAIPKALVMREMDAPRDTFVLERGVYDKHGAAVAAGVPAWLPPLPADAPRNRLGLARWLVSPENPLTARVTVNRYWQHFFGEGLVKTVNDFGSQGEWPSHPELLDWLAVEFGRRGQEAGGRGQGAGIGDPGAGDGRQRTVEGGRKEGTSNAQLRTPNVEAAQFDVGSSELSVRRSLPDPSSGAWDVKRVHRLIVTSATYRQSSASSPELRQKDPENRLLARGPRIRLGAEAVRDQALAACGLLVEQPGGPSVKPYQPPGLWEAVSYNGEQSYIEELGAGLYRRSLYTFWKRQAPPPAMLYFDGPTREMCTVKRGRTNTPLQALVLQNDPTYVEAARTLAAMILRECPLDPAARVRFAFRRVLGRSPEPDETAVLVKLAEGQLEEYRGDPAAARELLRVGESAAPAGADVAETAAWTVVVSALLNLDEAITKP